MPVSQRERDEFFKKARPLFYKLQKLCGEKYHAKIEYYSNPEKNTVVFWRVV